MKPIIIILLLKLSIVLSLGNLIKIQSMTCPNNNYRGFYIDNSNVILNYEYQCSNHIGSLDFESKKPQFACATTLTSNNVIIIESLSMICSYDLLSSILNCNNKSYKFDLVDDSWQIILDNQYRIVNITRSANDNMTDKFCDGAYYEIMFSNDVSDLEKIFISHAVTIGAIHQDKGDFRLCDMDTPSKTHIQWWYIYFFMFMIFIEFGFDN